MTALDDEYSADATPLETFTLTVPDRAAPRNRVHKGLPIRQFRLPPEAAQELEDSLVRLTAKSRTPVRLYRGDRELLPDLSAAEDEDLMRMPPPPTPGEESASVREAEGHLRLLQDSIRIAQERLKSLQADEDLARARRDKELQAHLALCEASQKSTLEQIRQARDHASREQLRAFETDHNAQEQITASWAQVTSNSQHMATVRKMLGDSVLADRTKEWLLIGKEITVGIADSAVGKMIVFHLAAQAATLINKGLSGKGPEIKPEHVMLAHALTAMQFGERRRLLQQYAAHAPKAVGQALLLAPDFCLGEADPAALRELIEQATEAEEAAKVASKKAAA